MGARPRRLPYLLFATLVLPLFLAVATARAQEGKKPEAVSPEEVRSVIETLKDPAARDRLIRELEVLARARQPSEVEGAAESLAAGVLAAASRRLQRFSAGVAKVAGAVETLPEVADWFRRQVAEPAARALWREVFTQVALALGLGYLVFFLARALLRRPRRAVTAREPGGPLLRAARLLLLLCFDLLPVAGFTALAYLLLGLVDPREKTRLVVLAWVQAFVLVRVAAAAGRFVVAPEAPQLRLVPVSDETAEYVQIWVSRLSGLALYGSFVLQAGLFLGLPEEVHGVLLRLLGLAVTMLVLVLILQNRGAVGDVLRRRRVLRRIAPVWHWPALLYTVMLYVVWALEVPGGFWYLARATLLTLLLLVLTQVALRVLGAVMGRGLRVSEDLQARFPGLEARANRYLSSVHTVLRGAIRVLAFLMILQAWQIDIFAWATSGPGRVLAGKAVSVLFILALALAAWEGFNIVVESYLARIGDDDPQGEAGRIRTLMTVARKALLVVLAVFSGMTVLSQLGVDIGPLLAGAGVFGLAVGFGAQKLVQDVMTGFFILFEDQLRVDDVVTVGERTGVVEALSIRTVRLRDLSGTVHTIPFSAIGTVSNLTKEFSFYVFDVGVAYREDVDEVIAVLRELGAELQADAEYGPLILEPLEVLGLNAFADSAVVVRARLKTVPAKQWGVGREFNRRMKRTFDERGIEIPFPHTTIYFGQDKEGKAPPAFLEVRGEGGSGAAGAS